MLGKKKFLFLKGFIFFVSILVNKQVLKGNEEIVHSIVQMATEHAKDSCFSDAEISSHQFITNIMERRMDMEQCSIYPCSFLISGAMGVGKKHWLFALAEKEKTKALTFYYNCQDLMVLPPSVSIYYLRIIFNKICSLSSDISSSLNLKTFLILDNVHCLLKSNAQCYFPKAEQQSFLEVLKNGLQKIFDYNCNEMAIEKARKNSFSGLYVFGVTNLEDKIDVELQTNKTFGLTIKIENPDVKTIEQFLIKFAKKYNLAKEIVNNTNLKQVAESFFLRNASFGKIVTVLNKALQNAMLAGKNVVSVAEINNVILEVFGGDTVFEKVNLTSDLIPQDSPFFINVFLPGSIKTRFEDLILPEEIKSLLDDVKLEIERSEYFKATKAKFPAGILLYGPPGVGKTLAAKAIAGEANAVFFQVDSTLITSKYLGESSKNVDAIFNYAEKFVAKGQKVIIFIDEIDAIATSRDLLHGSYGESNAQILTSLLNKIDGFSSEEKIRNIILLCATNRFEILDPALTRSGRLDRKIKIDLPTEKLRKKILERLAFEFPVKSIDLDLWAQKTNNFSGADLRCLFNEAAILAAKASSKEILEEHLLQGHLIFTRKEKKAFGKNFSKHRDFNVNVGQKDAPFYIKCIPPGTLETTFDDLILPEEIKNQLKDIKEEIINPEPFRKTKAKLPAGILLYGPPGVGKTFAAKAIAGECNCYFLQVDSSLVTSKWIGDSAKNVEAVFTYAEKLINDGHKVIVFMDEIDAIAKNRDDGFGSLSDNNSQILASLLNKLDGFSTSEERNLILLCSTNRFDVLDPALMRSGRLDRKIRIDYPSKLMRIQMLEKLSDKFPLKGADLGKWASKTFGYSGADFQCWFNEAAILAAKEDSSFITDLHLEKANYIFQHGLKDPSKIVTKRDLLETAIHELGHAINTVESKFSPKLDFVTIISHANLNALGFTSSKWDEDKCNYSKQDLLAKVQVLLGGYVAEEIFLNTTSAGVSSDIQKANSLIKDMVTKYLMVDLTKKTQDKKQKDFEDSEQQAIFLSCYENAKKVILRYKTEFLMLSLLLLEKESMSGEEVLAEWEKNKNFVQTLKAKNNSDYDVFSKELVDKIAEIRLEKKIELTAN